MKQINKIWQYLIEEAKLVADDHSILLTVIGAPILYFFFLGSIYMYKDIEKISFAVVDLDKSTTSRKLTRLLDSQQKIKTTGVYYDFAEAVDLLNNMDIQGFILFPKGFEKKLKRLDGADVKLYLNNTRFLPSNTLKESVSKLMLTVGAGIRMKYFIAQGIHPENARELVVPIMPVIKPMYNTTNNYGDFLLPGLFLLIIHQTLLLGLGESIARKRQHGFKGLKKAWEENSFFKYFIGKTGFYILLFTAYFFFLYTVVFPAFKLPLNGSILALTLVSFVFMVTVVLLTLLVASFYRSQIGYMEVIAFLSYPIFLISGYSWPVVSMPLPLQWLSKLMPISPMLESVRKLTVMGGSFEHIITPLINLLILGIIFYISVYFRFRYLANKSEDVNLPSILQQS
jgi:ABC-2 type transport system permease protein